MERLLNYPMPGPVSPGHDNPGYRPGGPQRRTTWLWISLAVAVVIIVLLSAVVITQLKDDASTSPRGANAIHRSSAVTTRQHCAATQRQRQPVDDLRGLYRISRREFTTWLARDH